MVPKSDGGRRRSQFAVDGGVSERRRRRRGYDDEIQWLDGLGFLNSTLNKANPFVFLRLEWID